MNVRYYLRARWRAPRDIPGLKPLGQFDLDLYESESAWPHAFFTDRLWRYASTSQLTVKARTGDRQPFAAIEIDERELPTGAQQLSSGLKGRVISPATHYRLTTNTTSFEVTASAAGTIVLSEPYYPDEFRLTVNGRPCNYFRINHAYKGIHLDAPGVYRVEFAYWPHTLTLSFILAGGGAGGAGWNGLDSVPAEFA